ncbi:superinfection immunity protein [Bacillus fonticola]|uniref:superinfection immunity protein n=1 Tax=Bacillus fonticola TaxID=2728853 RepID=UPI001D15A002|nr:superinfection immunity protein [Bacillus fonticola]
MEGSGALMTVLLLLGVVYFIPFLIAMLKRKTNTLAIFFLNLLAGWTFIGWVVAFIWSITKDNKVV